MRVNHKTDTNNLKLYQEFTQEVTGSGAQSFSFTHSLGYKPFAQLWIIRPNGDIIQRNRFNDYEISQVYVTNTQLYGTVVLSTSSTITVVARIYYDEIENG